MTAGRSDSHSGADRARVPDEATTFLLPAKSTLWYHDLEVTTNGIHTKADISEVKKDQWFATRHIQIAG